MPYHRILNPGDIHRIQNFEYADEAERTSAVYDGYDVGKVARQLDNNSYYIILSTTPTFLELGGGGGGSGDVTQTSGFTGADGYLSFFTGDKEIAGDNDLYFNRESNSLELNNRLLIGTSSSLASNPTSQLEISSNEYLAPPELTLSLFNNILSTADAVSKLIFRSTQGTASSPDYVDSGDRLGRIDFQGYYDGDDYAPGVRIDVNAAGTVGSSSMPGSFNLQTTAVGSLTPTTRLFVGADGDVGLSTSSPNARLEIEDGGTSSSVLLKITADDANPYGLVIGNDSHNTSDTNGLRFSVDNSGIASIRAPSGGAINIKEDGGATAIYIDSDGKIGMGTTTPDVQLDVENSVDAESMIRSYNPNTGTGAFASIRAVSDVGNMLMAASSTTSTQEIDGLSFEGAGQLLALLTSKMFIRSYVGPIHFLTEEKHVMTISSEQNVGIGTTLPHENLTVNGVIALQEITAADSSRDLDGYGRIYVKSDDKLYFKPFGTAEIDLTSGGGGSGDVTQTSGFAGSDGYLAFFTGDKEIAGDNDLFFDRVNNRLGLGTSSIPQGGIGGAKFAISGPDSSALGPHIQLATDVDDYPNLQLFGFTHDNVGVIFDAFWADGWTSSDAGSNYFIYKNADLLKFGYESGVAQGAAISWTTGMAMDSSGNVSIGTESSNEILTVEGVLSLDQQASPSTTAGYGKVYVKTDGKLYYISPEVSETDLTSGGGGGVTATQDSDGYISFFTGTDAIAGDNDLFWDRVDNRLLVKNKASFGSGTTDSNLSATVDIARTQDSATLLLRGGGSAQPDEPVLAFGWAHTNAYRHHIQTLHDGGSNPGNEISFWLWNTTDGTYGDPTREVLTLVGDGSVGIGTEGTTLAERLVIQDDQASSVAIQFRSDDSTVNGTDYGASEIRSGFDGVNYTDAFVRISPVTAADTYTVALRAQNQKVMIGTDAAPEGTLHVRTSDVSAPTPDVNADDFIIENNGNAGMTILTSDAGTGRVAFGDASNSLRGLIDYRHSSNSMVFYVLGDRMAIDSSGNVSVGGSFTAEAALHVRSSDVSSPTLDTNSDDFMIENNGNTGMTLISSDAGTGRVAFGDASNSLKGLIDYRHASDSMNFYVNSADRMIIDSTGQVGIGTTSPDSMLEVSKDADSLIITSAYGPSATPNFNGRRARGTASSPTPPERNDILAFFGGRGYDGSSFPAASDVAISMKAAETFSGSATGTYISFETTTKGTLSRAKRMRISEFGHVGIGTEYPHEALTINGFLSLQEQDNYDRTHDGYGSIWAKSDGTLQFTNDAGTDFDLTSSGSGDVTKVGTPVDSQIGVWTGDGTIEGAADFTWDGSSLNVDKDQADVTLIRITNASSADGAVSSLEIHGDTVALGLQSYGSGNSGSIRGFPAEDLALLTTFSSKPASRFVIGTGSGAEPISFTIANKHVMTMNSTGHIGILTDDPHEALTINGFLSLQEQDNYDRTHDGYGSIWAKSDGTLQFTNDAGTDFDLTAAGGSQDAPKYTVTSVQTTNFSASFDTIVRCDPSGGTFTVTLPAAAGGTGQTVIVKNTTGSTVTITIDGDGAETIDGNSSVVIEEGFAAITFVSYGSEWGRV